MYYRKYIKCKPGSTEMQWASGSLGFHADEHYFFQNLLKNIIFWQKTPLKLHVGFVLLFLFLTKSKSKWNILFSVFQLSCPFSCFDFLPAYIILSLGNGIRGGHVEMTVKFSFGKILFMFTHIFFNKNGHLKLDQNL